MIALFSDIHSNIEALVAVLEDMRARGVKRAFCLGDVVGYCANPVEVLDFVTRLDFVIIGNHDRAILTGPPDNFNQAAGQAIEWTQEQLQGSGAAMLKLVDRLRTRRREDMVGFLNGLPVFKRVEGMMFLHDSPADPGAGRYVRSKEDAREGFARFPDTDIFFMGHSHVPRVWTEHGYFVPEPDKEYPFRKKQIIDIGSVGQPRDKDTRASYVILDRGYRYVRVPYAFHPTQSKIREAGLAEHLAARLELGK